MLAPGSLAEEEEAAVDTVDGWELGHFQGPVYRWRPVDLSAGSGVGIDMLVPIGGLQPGPWQVLWVVQGTQPGRGRA